MLTMISQTAIGTADLAPPSCSCSALSVCRRPRRRLRHPRRRHRDGRRGSRELPLHIHASMLPPRRICWSISGSPWSPLPIGGVGAWFVGRKVAMTAMPQMVAIYNGMGGGAAGGIAAVELFGSRAHGAAQLVVTLLGALIGAVSMSGSVIAWAKLRGRPRASRLRFRGQQIRQRAWSSLPTLAVGGWIVFVTPGWRDAGAFGSPTWITIFFGLRPGVRHPDDPADRRRGHAGGDLDL